MRAFIALPIPDEIKKEIADIQRRLRMCAAEAKWVNPENCHLTFKFLGDIDNDQLQQITPVLATAGEKFSGYDVRLTDFGFFPNTRRPRVFFIETDHAEQLKTVAFWIEDRLEAFGFPKERKFKPHITLARFKTTKNISRLCENSGTIRLGLSFPADKIVLYKSTLTPTGPIYEEIAKVELH